MQNRQPKNCAIYTRVSTDMQAEKEFSSCESQEEKIRSFVKSQNGWSVSKIYSDGGYTGANTDRPALQELMSDVGKNKINVVLVYKIDRLTRSPKDFYQLIEFFENNNIDFISITERFDTSTPAGRLLRNIMLTFAQFERELVSERVKDKLLERAKKGMWNGGNVPFGYKRENKKLIVDKKEAETIELIFDTYLETKSLSKVYILLKEQNIQTRQNNNFSKSTVASILRNIIYSGRIKHSSGIYPSIHQPIISDEIFELAQNIHQKKNRKLRVYKNFLFGGLINCEECGSKMTPCFTNKYKNEKLIRYYYYRCTSTIKQNWDSCLIKQTSAEKLENYVLENLERISQDKEYVENLVFKLNNDSKATHRVGYELSESCSKFSPETIISTLKNLLSTLNQKKGISKNLLAKKFIKSIIYSVQNIKINLFYPENLKDFLILSPQNKSVPLSGDGNNERAQIQEKTSESKFVENGLAPRVGLEPTAN